MTELKIKLESLNSVNAFVAAAQKKDYDIDLMQGKYLVNAKSIMGIFSLDLTRPMLLKFTAEDTEFLKEIEIFKVEE